MADIKEDLIKQYREQQYKYAYYIVALCVAAIGFVTTQTLGKPLKLIQIPVGIAVVSWCTSIFLGLNYIKYQISGLYTNVQYLRIPEGTNREIGNNPHLYKFSMEVLENIIEKNSTKASKLGDWQDRCFYIGIIFFIIWHVLEMVEKSIIF